MGVGCPCPPICNNIVTLPHLFLNNIVTDKWAGANIPLPHPFTHSNTCRRGNALCMGIALFDLIITDQQTD